MILEDGFAQHIGIRDYQEKQPCCLHLLWLVHTQPMTEAYTPSELWNPPHILQVSQSTYSSLIRSPAVFKISEVQFFNLKVPSAFFSFSVKLN